MDQNYHNAVYKWVKSDEFQSPHHSKINPAYVTAYTQAYIVYGSIYCVIV